MRQLPKMPIDNWRHWSYEQYLSYFLSYSAARRRARNRQINICQRLGDKDFRDFCSPVRERLESTFSGPEPLVSIQMPCRNDGMELLATLVSYTLLDVQPGIAELIVSDNGSDDETPLVIEACGVTRAYAAEPGMGKARRAAYDVMAPSAQYVWLTDCDARVVAPKFRVSAFEPSTILRTNLKALKTQPQVAALSTGVVYEYTHPLFRIIRCVAVALRKAPRVHAWTGPNQFVRRAILDAIGGIHPDISYRSREDHQRMYELARHCKAHGLHILSAASNPSLYDPVYHSGRRRGTFRDVLNLVRRGRHTVDRLPKDQHGWPVHPNDRIHAPA